MTFQRTYAHTSLIAFDQFCAAMIFNRADITVSSLCWIVLAANGNVKSVPRSNDAANALNSLDLSNWQLELLEAIGERFLELFWPGHCVGAARSDRDRGGSAVSLLVGA